MPGSLYFKYQRNGGGFGPLLLEEFMQRLLRRKSDGVIYPWNEHTANLDTMEEYVADEPVKKIRRRKKKPSAPSVDNSDLGVTNELPSK